MIKISSEAKEYWTGLLEKSEQKYVRLSLKGSGCAGFAYVWEYSDDDSDGTLIDDLIVVDDIVRNEVAGSTVDMVTSMTGSEITITNPNVASSCGCGESIQFEA
tara:strand:- start:126 stop:437 length:312 start_codon:yes stop_codon:yes gene_type:complete